MKWRSLCFSLVLGGKEVVLVVLLCVGFFRILTLGERVGVFATFRKHAIMKML